MSQIIALCGHLAMFLGFAVGFIRSPDPLVVVAVAFWIVIATPLITAALYFLPETIGYYCAIVYLCAAVGFIINQATYTQIHGYV